MARCRSKGQTMLPLEGLWEGGGGPEKGVGGGEVRDCQRTKVLSNNKRLFTVNLLDSLQYCCLFSFYSFKTYSTATIAAAQFSVTSPLSLLGNVDVRSLSDASSSSLTEAGGEEDDEQNCPPYSGTLTN